MAEPPSPPPLAAAAAAAGAPASAAAAAAAATGAASAGGTDEGWQDLQPALQSGSLSRAQRQRLGNAFARLQVLRRCQLAPQAATHAWRSVVGVWRGWVGASH